MSGYALKKSVVGRIPPVVLGNLPEKQLAITMIREEAESFSQDDDNVGCFNGLQMKLTPSDPKPVQKTCPSVPHPLCTQLKHYIEDLLNWGWITKPHSSYASPVACVRKKDGGLRPCIDYRELHQKNCTRPPTNPKDPGDIAQPWWKFMVLSARLGESLSSRLY